MITYFIAGFSIFALRVIDMSLGTTRLLMVLNGRKLLAWILAFFQALIFISVVSSVLLNIGDWVRVLGYSAGFATGLVVGMMIESWLALGYSRLRIISSRLGGRIAETLRDDRYGVTEISAQGKDGTVTILDVNVPRRQTDKVVNIIKDIDEDAFITAESVRSIKRGFMRN